MCHTSNVAMSAFSTPETNERRQLTWVFICYSVSVHLRWKRLLSYVILLLYFRDSSNKVPICKMCTSYTYMVAIYAVCSDKGLLFLLLSNC